MKISPRRLFLFFSISLVIISCRDKQCEESPDTSDIKIDLKVERLDKAFDNIKSKNELGNLLNKNRELALVLSANDYPNDSIFFEELYRRITDPHIDTINRDIEKVFGDFSETKNEFEEAFRKIKYYYPNFQIPEIKTIATGFFSPDFFLTDSTLYVALDYFTGPEGHYPPPQEPEYIVKRYRKEYLVPTVVRLISTKFNAIEEQDKSLLAEMVYWGKSYYFVNKMMPCTPDSLIIGYTQKSMERAAKNQERIWAHFVENQLLYETSFFKKTKYIGDRPYTAEISSKCPGRIGQWLGWKVVNKYMEEEGKDMVLPGLMANKNAKLIFSKSKFKPKNGEGL